MFPPDRIAPPPTDSVEFSAQKLFVGAHFCHKPGVANLAHGIYEALLDEDLSALLAQHPELRSVFAKIDPEEEPARYAAFLARVIEKALSLENDPVARLRLCNEIVDRIAGTPSAEFLRTRRLVSMAKPLVIAACDMLAEPI